MEHPAAQKARRCASCLFTRAPTCGARNRVKEVCRALVDAVKAGLARLDDWRSKEKTKAQVKTLIHDFLYADETGLPAEFQADEIEVLATVVYQHVHMQYRSANDNAYAA